jgi:hypothetical protein
LSLKKWPSPMAWADLSCGASWTEAVHSLLASSKSISRGLVAFDNVRESWSRNIPKL